MSADLEQDEARDTHPYEGARPEIYNCKQNNGHRASIATVSAAFPLGSYIAPMNQIHLMIASTFLSIM